MGRTEKKIVTASERHTSADSQGNDTQDGQEAPAAVVMTDAPHTQSRSSSSSSSSHNREGSNNNGREGSNNNGREGSAGQSGLMLPGSSTSNRLEHSASGAWAASPTAFSAAEGYYNPSASFTSQAFYPGSTTPSYPSTSYYRYISSSTPRASTYVTTASPVYHRSLSGFSRVSALPSSTVYSSSPSHWTSTHRQLGNSYRVSPPVSTVYHSGSSFSTSPTSRVTSSRFYTPPRSYSSTVYSSALPSTVYRSITPPVYRRHHTPRTTTTVYPSRHVSPIKPITTTTSTVYSAPTLKSSFSLGGVHTLSSLAPSPLYHQSSGARASFVSRSPIVRKTSVISHIP